MNPGTINTIMFESSAWHDALLGRKTTAEFWREMGPRLGLHSPLQVDNFRQRYYADEKINSHVRELIGRLSKHYKLAICSNSPAGLKQWLADWGIDRLFDVVFCSGEEGIVKPDPAAYRITLTRLDVKPWEAVFVDDVRENVEAASKQGLKAVHFTTGAALEKDLAKILRTV